MNKKIALINGPNLNLLGSREPEIYGSETLDSVVTNVSNFAEQANYDIWPFQSNIEGELVTAIQTAGSECEGIIINAGAYTHTSIAIRDALALVNIPIIEVHISNVYKREKFRHHSHISPVADGVIVGLGTQGYILAFGALLQTLEG